KGHMKDYETERQTAVREVREETGLDVTILPDFRELIEYIIPVNGHLKKVTYYLATYQNQNPVPQPEEVRKIVLLPYEEAMGVFQYENNRTLLQKAYRTILKNNY
ncbi:MAG: NUDIX domain-containing protein, partial [Erysipelotrichaceae bacterium]|nr:NUDIX domain-containing protein [Erysipelotrichaceae bacterium]